MQKRRDKLESALFHCPFLGLEDDPDTALAFPSIWNCCHHCKPVVSINIDHQRDYCQSTRYPDCPAYLQPPDQILPDEIHSKNPTNSASRASQFLIPILAIFTILIILGGIFFTGTLYNRNPTNNNNVGSLNSLTPAPIQQNLSPEATSTSTPSATRTIASPTLQPASTFPTADKSFLVAPTSAVTRTPHEIESLIGLNYVFRIHRAHRSEDIYVLAQENGTTAAAILAVNYIIKLPLKGQQLVVIPYNRTDVSDLPPFEAHRVTEDTTVDILGKQLEVDPSELQLYNGLGTYTQLHKGEWLVVPRKKSRGE